jgi:small conductance mechanosensitive channel
MTIEEIFSKTKVWMLTDGLKLVVGVLVLYFVFKIINIFSRRLERKLRKRRKALDETITKVSLSIFRKGLKILAFICFLGYVGIETTSIAAAITSAGLGVGLALQGSLSNFAGGVIILVMRPYKLGDYIECNGLSGTVEDIKTFYTYIVTIDNKVVMIPNGKMADSSIINYSTKDLRRLDLFFNVEYNSDIGVVKKALLDSVINSSMYKENIEPFINIEEYKENYIKVVLKVWCDNSKYWDLYYYLQEEVKRQFAKYNINVPYNKVKLV